MVRTHVARAGAGEELGRDRLDHPPLRRAGVLRLVDQDVVEPPSSRQSTQAATSGRCQQVARPVDQVVEVEQPRLPALRAAQAVEPVPREAVERRRPREGGIGDAAAAARPRPAASARRAPASARRSAPAPPSSGTGRSSRRRAPSPPCRTAARPRAARARCRARRRPARARQPLGVARTAPASMRNEPGEQRPRSGGQHFGGEAGRSDLRPRAEQRSEARRIEGRREGGPMRAISTSSGIGIVGGQLAGERGEVLGVRRARARRAPPRAAPAPAGPPARRTAARPRPPAESAAAAPRRRRGWSGSSGRPASPAPGRTACAPGRAASGGTASPASPSSRNAARSAASSSIAQPPSVLNSRFCISAAAALV